MMFELIAGDVPHRHIAQMKGGGQILPDPRTDVAAVICRCAEGLAEQT